MTPPLVSTEPAPATLPALSATRTVRTPSKSAPRVPRHWAVALPTRSTAQSSAEPVAALNALVESALAAGVSWLTVELPQPFAAGVLSTAATLAARGIDVRVLSTEPAATEVRALNEAANCCRPDARERSAPLVLTLAARYDARADLAAALRQSAGAFAKGAVEKIEESVVRSYLRAGELPAVDLLMLSGSSGRLTPFLLWHAAYAELQFVPRCWTGGTAREFRESLAAFSSRNRTFGALK